MDKINNLLQQVTIIQKKYDEIAKITGENFNIFSVMRAESDEVRTHSRIIAEFLNPKGKHAQGSVFLKLFFDKIDSLVAIKESFDFENTQVIVEEHIGTIDKEYSEGGFIDIVIKDSKYQIVIENKIYAGDQKGQLLRYKNSYPDCVLIYLTLDGKEPSSDSYKLGNDKDLNLEEIFLMSYKNDIKNWIENSLEKTHSLPIIRETLAQYLHLIKKLTNQSTNKKMSSEIQDLILANFSAAEQIVKDFDNVKYKICGGIRADIINKLKEKLKDKYDVSDQGSNVGDKNSKIWIELQKYKGNSVLFGIEPFSGNGNNSKELFYGIIDLHAINKGVFEKYSEFQKSGWWREIKYFQDFENFKIDFSDSNFISFLGKNKDKKDELVSVLAQQIISYIEFRENDLIKIHEEIRIIKNN
ncbi:hypothetical protein FSS13T_01260 [Flavobacterium saliperosum S13]|uniref:PD-(D/E)XK nuclease superfamily protein n=2 Tax=Flavobacterium saliperosum TaxID=329186 RepID=A0A1G4V2T5_9FLAO|nr:PD-(D/E)XK nuclease family protein [Flavobacterium saliperosum]ESU27657.1 hypothetical protein FSS13T_01260 [Flavobacterium saliperosum S13]SCX00264.1 PD-(D/E)XK nuclease superfamily protein [Flavobacterium saliperosum]